MIVKYGGNARADHENWFRFENRFRHNRLGRPQSIINRATIWGVLKADSQSALTTAINQLESDFSEDGGDLIVYLSDGTTPTQHFILNSGTIDGVRVKSINYLDRDPRHGQSGCEYVNRRTYQIVLEAERFDADASQILLWEETVIGIGTGGSVFIQKPALTGPPQRQAIQQFSSYGAIQVGRAIGYTGYPIYATPIWPGDEHVEKRRIELGTPKFGAVRNTEFPVTWRYEFESARILTGGPNLI